jgi:hypothetical protein
MRRMQSTHANLSTVIKLLMILSLALLIQACDDDERPPREENRAGGMVMTTETPAAEGESAAPAADAPTEAPAEPTPTPEPTPAPLSVGQIVTSTAQIRLYADATTSSAVLEVYEAPTLFSVMEPSAEYDQYPVASASGVWYRVRAADGLAGWAKADALIGQ